MRRLALLIAGLMTSTLVWTHSVSAKSSDSNDTLMSEIQSFALELGQPAAASQVGVATLPDTVADPLSLLLGDLLECHKKSNKAKAGRSIDQLLAGDLDPAQAAEVTLCGRKAESHSLSLTTALRTLTLTERESLSRIDIWPVIRFEPDAAANTYIHDYALLIDLGGGNDVYRNNVGGNLLDVRRGPTGSGAIENGPAEGCQNIPALVIGNCVISAATLIDMGGNDTYGVKEPADEDSVFVNLFDGTTSRCTSEPLIRRIVTGGSGFLGVGILIDEAGNDHYLGKTVALGAGHVAGVGVLRDRGAGSDQYSAIRYAMGNGLVGGAYGLLLDDGGNDSYGYYMPAGDDIHEGGIVNDKGLCDATPREVMGTGKVGASGILQDEGGNDSYVGPATSQGHGSDGGTGLLWDWNGKDTYQGAPGRANGVTILPGLDSTGTFIDET